MIGRPLGGARLGASKRGTRHNTGGARFGPNLITNGTFAADSNWSKGTGWSIGSGVASCDGSQAGNTLLQQNNILVASQFYRIEADITVTAGTLQPAAGNTGNGPAYSSSQHIDLILKQAGTAGQLHIFFRGNVDFTGTVDNVRVRKVL